MTDELALEDDDTTEIAVVDPATKPGLSKKKKIIAAIAALVLLLAAGIGAYLWFTSGKSKAEHQEIKADAPTIDVPPIVVNLRSNDGAPHFLKVHFVILPTDEKAGETVTAQMPRIIDAYQPFLRELRPEDVAGSAAVYRLKEELALRTASVVGEGIIRDVLVQDMIQQ